MLHIVGSSRNDEGNLELHYCLDVDNGINANGTQIHIWDAVLNGITQTFTFEKTNQETYIIRTKCSNYSKVVSLADNLCDNGINVHQWEYSSHSHDHWILEPIVSDTNMGISYAKANHHNRLEAYPNVSQLGGDCTNFVSQCLLSGGWHQDNNWYVKRTNTTYHDIRNVEQLNESWNLADPSPWISAKEFKNKFIEYDNSYYCKSSYIRENPQNIYAMNYYKGDVIQYADNILGFIGDAKHTMYIRGYTTGTVSGSTENYPTFELTYHSTDTEKIDLLTIAENHPLRYFVFYDFTP